jgi:hypothetical protein
MFEQVKTNQDKGYHHEKITNDCSESDGFLEY